MKHTNIKNIALLLVALVAISGKALGQDDLKTPAAFEQLKSKSQWQQISNSAGLMLDNPINFTEVAIGYETYTGSFHSPQEGESGSNLNFGAEGAILLDKSFVLGKFDYIRSIIKDANFNSSIIDPFRGMPYMVADTGRSKWYNQTYDMAFKVASPKLWNKLTLGLEAEYKTVSGAKQRDPRTKNLFYTIIVKPGFVFSANSKHHIGANFEYYNLKEESVTNNVNSYVDQQYYVLYGLGTAVSGIGSGPTLNYKGNNVGGGLQYNYQGVVNLLVSGTYSYKVEDVERNFTTPQDNASVKDHIWNGNLQLYKSFGRLTHFLTMDYTDRQIDGIECITQYDNTGSQNGYVTLSRDIRSTYKMQTATFSYDVTVDRNQEYSWKFGAGVIYKNQEDVYLVSLSEKTAENIMYQVRAKKNFIFGGSALNRRILLGADYSYNRNIAGHYDYNGTHADYPVVTDFETMDTYYLNSSFFSLGFAATYYQKLKQDIRANVFAKAEFRHTNSKSSYFNNRNVFQLTLGFNF